MAKDLPIRLPMYQLDILYIVVDVLIKNEQFFDAKK
jgi:hypothetical protein